MGAQSEKLKLNFMNYYTTNINNGKKKQTLVQSELSRGQIKVHEALKRDIIPFSQEQS